MPDEDQKISNDQSGPKPAPSPSPSAQPSTAPASESNAGKHEASEPEAVKSQHVVDRSGEGAPGDMSGVFTATENPGAQAGDYSHLTGRNEHDGDVTESSR